MKLLRALQEKEFRAVGSLGQRSSNFRVIAASNRDLAAEVQALRFRQDLFYRLNVMRLRIPPLRERKDDIPVLVAHFINTYGNGHRLTDDVMEALLEYEWPGNVRELEHVLQQMIAMNSGPWLNETDLPSFVLNRSLERHMAAESHDIPLDVSSLLPGSHSVLPLAEVEKRAILQAIHYTKGDRTIASALLGIGRTTLYRKLKEYGVDAG
jgi:DNA-binding NtrC family response regulator